MEREGECEKESERERQRDAAKGASGSRGLKDSFPLLGVFIFRGELMQFRVLFCCTAVSGPV